MNGVTASGWLLHTLAGGGLLLLLAWVWAAWTRQPARRLRVAEWAVAASLVLAVLSLGPAWLVVTTPAPPVPAQPPAQRPESGAPAPPAPPVPSVKSLPVPAEPTPHAPALAKPAPSRRWWTWEADHFASVAACLYFTVAASLLGRWLLGWFALRRLMRRCTPVRGRAARLFAEMADGGPRPRLLASPSARAPFSCGLLRPAVVLPADMAATAPDEVLRWVFAHELAHLRRRDAWSALLFGLGQTVYFAVPWFWRLRRQARLCQEYLADAAAAAAGGRPEDYAQFLLAWTAAPRPPVGACGVWGRSSDLFWRVKTMLQSPVPLERRCPRRLSLAAACGLLSVAVLAAGFTMRASAAPAPEPNKVAPKEEDPNADRPAPEVPALPNFDDVLKNLPADLPPEQLAMMRANIERMRKMMEQRRQNGLPDFSFPNVPFNPGLPAVPHDVRLGVVVEKPGDTLAEQLELPRDQGLVIREVMADSPASRAGLKAHDILLELDGKPVSSNPEEFRKTVGDIKADAPVEAVVLRKGKKETLKGLTLSAAKPAAAEFPAANPFAAAGFGAANAQASGNGVTTTTTRTNDQFRTRHQEGGLVITLTGKVTDGKATVSEIGVLDNGESKTYDSLDQVPEKYRDKVKGLVKMSEKGAVKAEAKTP